MNLPFRCGCTARKEGIGISSRGEGEKEASNLGINPAAATDSYMYAAAQFDKSEQKEAKFILPSGDIPLVTYSARREKGLRPPQASAIYSLNNTNRNR